MNELAVCSYCGEVTNPAHHECGGTTIYPIPIYMWKITIGGPKGIMIKMETKAPNRFQRWMYKFLLDWEINLL